MIRWVLDASFNEDDSRIRSNNAPENMALLRRWVINVFNLNKSKKTTKSMLRSRAASSDFVAQMLKKTAEKLSMMNSLVHMRKPCCSRKVIMPSFLNYNIIKIIQQKTQ